MDLNVNRASNRTLLRVLGGETVSPPPVWLMRQAGRYLPEYREVRKRAGSFLNLCYTPELACEVTLQPIRRFGFDAAILFSDILVIPDALGRQVDFVQGEGPVLDPIDSVEAITVMDPGAIHDRLEPVYEAVERIRAALPYETTFLGFCGAPWTVATYMIAGRGTPDQAPARLFAYRHPEAFRALIDVLVESSIAYLVRQFAAGADAVQVFDTWAGILTETDFRAFALEPMQRIVAGVRAEVADARIIGFPRGAGPLYTAYARETGIDGLGLDWSVPLDFARDQLSDHVALQGNIDPLLMVSGGAALDRAVDRLLSTFAGKRLIVNLGHGITPEGQAENVERLIARVRRG